MSQKKYKLIDILEYPTKINVATRRKGYLQYAQMTLEPKKIYVIPEGDSALETSLFECGIKK